MGYRPATIPEAQLFYRVIYNYFIFHRYYSEVLHMMFDIEKSDDRTLDWLENIILPFFKDYDPISEELYYEKTKRNEKNE